MLDLAAVAAAILAAAARLASAAAASAAPVLSSSKSLPKRLVAGNEGSGPAETKEATEAIVAAALEPPTADAALVPKTGCVHPGGPFKSASWYS